MATGASKARRDAKKQAAKAYYDALSKVEKVDPLKKIDTQGARKLSNEFGDEISYGAKRIAMQADRVARKINQDQSLNNDIGEYNKRVDEIDRQKNGETVKKFSVVQDKNTGTIADLATSKIGGESSIGKFDTLEAANAANPNPKPPATRNGFISPDNNFGFASFAGGKKANPTYSVKEENLTPISANYRQLSGTQGAYKDLEKLSKKVGDNPAGKFSQEYEALANKLRGKLARDVGNPSPKSTGLLGSELASGAPLQEVIS
jgi:hypothetical protein